MQSQEMDQEIEAQEMDVLLEKPNGDANSTEKEDGEDDASGKKVKKTPRFMVENVESPNKSPSKKEKETEFGYPDPAETIGFATHEAVPMTMFYRNQSSLGDNVAQRPTLRELHEGFDVLDEDMVRFFHPQSI